MDSLEADGLMDETIVFFFGDHGFGMPRYKRWLYNTGLHVPLIIRAPEKYKHLFPTGIKGQTQQLVSFVDFAPTILQLAEINAPLTMAGQAFLGRNVIAKREFVYAARDRADDMYEMSRAVMNDRYLYIRHYMPHLPYIQSGYIYSDIKDGFRSLRQARKQGLNNNEQEKMWQPKPVEELYDLKEDPQELNNLANDPKYSSIKAALKEKLHGWMIVHKDLGLLPEAEYMIRSKGMSPYEYARNSPDYQIEKILATAELVGSSDETHLLEKTKDPDSGVRFWAVMALLNLDHQSQKMLKELNRLLNDPSPSVQIIASETLCRKTSSNEAVDVLGKWVQDERPWLALQAARSIQLVEEHARPLIPILYQVLDKNLGQPGAKLKYKNFNFAAFTSWALEWALQEMGEEIKVN